MCKAQYHVRRTVEHVDREVDREWTDSVAPYRYRNALGVS